MKRRNPSTGVFGLILLGAASTLAGCGGVTPSASGPSATLVSTSAATNTVAFESIDGPPPQVFDRFVQVLDGEALSRNVAVVSRTAPAGYHVRAYLSAQVRGGRTLIAWVWDVYDRNQQRVLRLSGEEDGGRNGGRDAWTAADAALLRRIAQSALISLSGYVNGTAPPERPPLDRSGPAVASLSDTPADTPADAPAAMNRGVALGFSAQ
ncbi:MAG: hypothetical protein P4M07_12350 [Xanthobacteraceae bacterium]|nr:hypothetical protein [Xanthobacteraceae bacterium]